MSTNPTIDLAGLNIKEWSLIILLLGLAFVFVVVAIGLAYAISSGSEIKFTGSFDLSQYQAVIIGVAMVAVVLVSQQLTAKSNAAAVAVSKS